MLPFICAAGGRGGDEKMDGGGKVAGPLLTVGTLQLIQRPAWLKELFDTPAPERTTEPVSLSQKDVVTAMIANSQPTASTTSEVTKPQQPGMVRAEQQYGERIIRNPGPEFLRTVRGLYWSLHIRINPVYSCMYSLGVVTGRCCHSRVVNL